MKKFLLSLSIVTAITFTTGAIAFALNNNSESLSENQETTLDEAVETEELNLEVKENKEELNNETAIIETVAEVEVDTLIEDVVVPETNTQVEKDVTNTTGPRNENCPYYEDGVSTNECIRQGNGICNGTGQGLGKGNGAAQGNGQRNGICDGTGNGTQGENIKARQGRMNRNNANNE